MAAPDWNPEAIAMRLPRLRFDSRTIFLVMAAFAAVMLIVLEIGLLTEKLRRTALARQMERNKEIMDRNEELAKFNQQMVEKTREMGAKNQEMIEKERRYFEERERQSDATKGGQWTQLVPASAPVIAWHRGRVVSSRAGRCKAAPPISRSAKS